jgi:hypothetical protein
VRRGSSSRPRRTTATGPTSTDPLRAAGAALLGALVLLGAPAPRVRAQATPPAETLILHLPLRAGPGAGYRSDAPGMLRPIDADTRVQPIFTAGDTLAGSGDAAPFPFIGFGSAVAAIPRGDGTADVYVAHDLAYSTGFGGAVATRLLLDLGNGGVLAADYALDGTEWYSELTFSVAAGPDQGFLTPVVFLGEGSVTGPRRGVVAAVNPRDGTIRDLPWLGRFAHRALAFVPVSSGGVAAVLTERGDPGASHVYLYLAASGSDFLSGRGQLYVLRAEPDPGLGRALTPAGFLKGRDVRGRFVPITARDAADPSALAGAAQATLSLSFVQAGGVAPDRERNDAFYFTDGGDNSLFDVTTGRALTGSGRLYHVALDPFDPTVVTALSVVLDGDAGDDLYRPDDLASDDASLMIQENPRADRGLHVARVLRYDPRQRRLTPLAVCAERDRLGRELPAGVGGAWETHGIVSAEDLFGPDTWLLTVEARTLEAPVFGYRGQSGQLLLLRGPRSAPRQRGQ